MRRCLTNPIGSGVKPPLVDDQLADVAARPCVVAGCRRRVRRVIGCFEVGGQLAQGLWGAVHDFRASSGGVLSLAIRADPAHLSTR